MKPNLTALKFCFVFALISFKVHAQFTVETKIEDVYKLNLINPGISLEKKIFKYNTVQANIFWNTTINLIKNSDLLTKQYNMFLDPTINIQYRHYYNYYKRADRGAIIENNGANFIGGMFERTVTRLPIQDKDLVETARPVFKLGAIYGLQRTLFNVVVLEGYLGTGYLWETKSLQTSDGNTTKYQSGSFGIFAQLNIGIPVL
ncbi:MAG: hypothetical protein ACO29O_05970 [Chitinophagaceae bacterium]